MIDYARAEQPSADVQGVGLEGGLDLILGGLEPSF